MTFPQFQALYDTASWKHPNVNKSPHAAEMLAASLAKPAEVYAVAQDGGITQRTLAVYAAYRVAGSKSVAARALGCTPPNVFAACLRVGQAVRQWRDGIEQRR